MQMDGCVAGIKGESPAAVCFLSNVFINVTLLISEGVPGKSRAPLGSCLFVRLQEFIEAELKPH